MQTPYNKMKKNQRYHHDNECVFLLNSWKPEKNDELKYFDCIM